MVVYIKSVYWEVEDYYKMKSLAVTKININNNKKRRKKNQKKCLHPMKIYGKIANGLYERRLLL